jgi:tRNA G26 N,N-dimethylase Trm1
MTNTNIYDSLFSEVLVFKTNILSDGDVEKIGRVLASESNITRWNIDRNDIDKVLRIECDQLQPKVIIKLLRDAGFECEELPD